MLTNMLLIKPKRKSECTTTQRERAQSTTPKESKPKSQNGGDTSGPPPLVGVRHSSMWLTSLDANCMSDPLALCPQFGLHVPAYHKYCAILHVIQDSRSVVCVPTFCVRQADIMNPCHSAKWQVTGS